MAPAAEMLTLPDVLDVLQRVAELLALDLDELTPTGLRVVGIPALAWVTRRVL